MVDGVAVGLVTTRLVGGRVGLALGLGEGLGLGVRVGVGVGVRIRVRIRVRVSAAPRVVKHRCKPVGHVVGHLVRVWLRVRVSRARVGTSRARSWGLAATVAVAAASAPVEPSPRHLPPPGRSPCDPRPEAPSPRDPRESRERSPRACRIWPARCGAR